jgi:hypothetical protein
MGLSFLLFWVGISIAVAVAADSKGRSAVGWFFLALLISPLIAGLIILALPSADSKAAEQRKQFQAQAIYKGTPYRVRPAGNIEAMLPGGAVIFRNMEEFSAAVDGGTIELKPNEYLKAEFPNELGSYLYRVEKDGSVAAVNGLGERVEFRKWQHFWDAVHRHS